MCLHPSVSLNNEKICREFSQDKIAVCEKTAGLRSGNSSDLNSDCLKVLVPVEIFQFSDMHYETERYRDSTHGLRKILSEANFCNFVKKSFFSFWLSLCFHFHNLDYHSATGLLCQHSFQWFSTFFTLIKYYIALCLFDNYERCYSRGNSLITYF